MGGFLRLIDDCFREVTMTPFELDQETDQIFQKRLSNAESIDWDACEEAFSLRSERPSRIAHPVALGVTGFLLLLVACSVPVSHEESVGYTVSGLFDFGNPRESMDQIREQTSAFIPSGGSLETRFSFISDLSSGKPQTGSFVVVMPSASREEAQELAGRLERQALISDVLQQDITVEIERPWSVGLFPNSVQESEWVSRLKLGTRNNADEAAASIEEHASAFARSVFETDSSMAPPDINNGEDLGAFIAGKMSPDQEVSHEFSQELQRRHSEIFGERPGFWSSGFVLNQDGTDRYHTIYISLPGTNSIDAQEIVVKVSELPGVYDVSASRLASN